MPNPIRGAWLQHWQYGPSAAAERTLAEVLELARTWGFTGVLVKAMDGLDWMGDIPGQRPYADALRSVGQAVRQQELAANHGLGYGVWTNPLYNSDPTWQRAQAAAYALLGSTLGSMTWDSEPYEHFWGPNRPDEAVRRTMEAFRATAPDCWNIWQPDPRPARLAELGTVWGQYMNTFAGQDYWTDFGEGAIGQLDQTHRIIGDAKERGVLYAGADWCPTLPGNGTKADIDRALRWAQAVGCPGAIFWRLGTMGRSQLEAVLENPWPAVVDPEPPADPCAAIRAELEQKTLRIGAAVAYVDGPAAFSRSHLVSLLTGELPF